MDDDGNATALGAPLDPHCDLEKDAPSEANGEAMIPSLTL